MNENQPLLNQEKRKCALCGKPLSMYNKKNQCNSHGVSETEMSEEFLSRKLKYPKKDIPSLDDALNSLNIKK